MGKMRNKAYLLHDIAEYIRSLLCCDGVCIVLRCFDSALCHPEWRHVLSVQDTPLPRYYGTITDLRLLTEERVWAVCDMALQTGQLWTLDTEALQQIGSEGAASPGDPASATTFLLIAPLECPGGVVGFLLCTATAEHMPGEVECRFLYQFLPRIASKVEATLRAEHANGAMTEEVTKDTAVSRMPQWPDDRLPDAEELLSVVSHDLRAPLSIIKGYVGLLQVYGFPEQTEQYTSSGVMSATCRQKYFTSVMEQINHLEVLIGDLLDASRIRSGRIKLNRTPLALGELCQQVALQIQDRMDQQEVGRYAIQCILDPALPPVLADAHRVQQVVMNLVENAIKYSPEGGLIEIFVYTHYALQHSHALAQQAGLQSLLNRRREQFPVTDVYVTIRDYGIGIPLQQQSILFQPLQQQSQASERMVSSHGLGLYIARRLVEAMQGRILLKSQEGKGTCVTFSLPAVASGTSADETDSPRSYNEIGCLVPTETQLPQMKRSSVLRSRSPLIEECRR